MRHLLTFSIIYFFALFTVPAFSQKPATTENTIRQLEENRRVASLSGDTKKLAEIMAPEFYEIGRNGNYRTRKQNFDERSQGIISFDSLSFDSIQIKVLGDLAIVTGIVNSRGKYAGHPFQNSMIRYSRIYQYRKRKWLIVFGQNTPIVNN